MFDYCILIVAACVHLIIISLFSQIRRRAKKLAESEDRKMLIKRVYVSPWC